MLTLGILFVIIAMISWGIADFVAELNHKLGVVTVIIGVVLLSIWQISSTIPLSSSHQPFLCTYP